MREMLEYLPDPAQADKAPFLLSTEACCLPSRNEYELAHLLIDRHGTGLFPLLHFWPESNVTFLGSPWIMSLHSRDPCFSKKATACFSIHYRCSFSRCHSYTSKRIC